MGHETIATYMRPGFPHESVDETSYRTLIEYVGPKEKLESSNSGIAVRIPWGTFPGIVNSAELVPMEGTDYATLTVSVERKFESNDYQYGGGEVASTNYEIDWVDVQRSMYEHPEFDKNGTGAYKLDDEDIAAIKSWDICPDPSYKKIWVYSKDDWKTPPDATFPTLSDNAKKFAEGMLLGIEYWIDKAPIARKNEEYTGGPPPKGTAGKKETPPSNFPNLPAGYEWIRNADRAIKQGGQTKWQRSIEWVGAVKVLVDTKNIYW